MILLDKHVVIWAATDDPRLGARAREQIAKSDRTQPFRVSAISAWEIALLVQVRRLNLGEPAQSWLETAMKHQVWQNSVIDFNIAIESINLPGDFHSDPADRLIVATARINDWTIITADPSILDYAKPAT